MFLFLGLYLGAVKRRHRTRSIFRDGLIGEDEIGRYRGWREESIPFWLQVWMKTVLGLWYGRRRASLTKFTVVWGVHAGGG